MQKGIDFDGIACIQEWFVFGYPVRVTLSALPFPCEEL